MTQEGVLETSGIGTKKGQEGGTRRKVGDDLVAMVPRLPACLLLFQKHARLHYGCIVRVMSQPRMFCGWSPE